MASKPKTADLLYGAEAIAAHLELTKRQVLHLHEKSQIPTFKMGRTVCALRTALAAHFQNLTAETR